MLGVQSCVRRNAVHVDEIFACSWLNRSMLMVLEQSRALAEAGMA